jgi:hypothetical protein
MAFVLVAVGVPPGLHGRVTLVDKAADLVL